MRPCPVPRRLSLSLSLDENLRAKEGGKEKTGETALKPPFFYLAHGPLRVVTSHSRFALTSLRNHAKNEAPEEEAGWDPYYTWVQMLLQMGPLLYLGPVIKLVPSTPVSAVRT